jgi:hypothetical protein
VLPGFVVDRHRFDADPGPDPIQIFSIITMLNHIRILPEVLHMFENRATFLNFYSQPCQFAMFLVFLTSGKCVMKSSNLDNILSF